MRIGPVHANFGGTGCVEQAPVGADAAFEALPRLIEGFDDVVVDAEPFSARHELARDGGLLHAAWLGFLAVVTAARPAEFRDHDALAFVHLAQLVIDVERVLDGLRRGRAIPVGQNVRGDEVDRSCEAIRNIDTPLFGSAQRVALIDRLQPLVLAEPDVPGFTGRHRH